MEIYEFCVVVAVAGVVVVLTNWYFSHQKLYIQQTAEKAVAGQVNLKIEWIEERSKQRCDDLYDRISSLNSKVNANMAEIESLGKSNRNLRQKIIELESQCDQLKEENRNLKRELAEARSDFENKSSLGLGMERSIMVMAKHRNRELNHPVNNSTRSSSPTTNSSGLLTNEDDQ